MTEAILHTTANFMKAKGVRDAAREENRVSGRNAKVRVDVEGKGPTKRYLVVIAADGGA